MPRDPGVRWDVPTAETLRHLVVQPLPLSLRSDPAVRSFHRDLYVDTTDGALRSRQTTCWLRLHLDGRRELFLLLPNGGTELRLLRADAASEDPIEAAREQSEPARALRAVVSPAALGVDLELETDRQSREAYGRWPNRARFSLHYDVVTVRAAGLARSFQELLLRERRGGRPDMARLARALGEAHGLRSVIQDRHTRGGIFRTALESEALARSVGAGRWVVVAALDGPQIACLVENGTPRLPAAEGSGETACRHLMSQTLGSAVGELHLLATVLGEGRMRSVEVWLLTHPERGATNNGSTLRWIPLADLEASTDAEPLSDPPTLAAMVQLDRAGLLDAPEATSAGHTAELRAILPPRPASGDGASDDPMLDGELSLLEFNARVLAMAEDETTPLLERLRYVSIVAANFDEFFQVRVGKLKYGGASEDGDGDAERQLPTIRQRVLALVARQRVCAEACLRALDARGVHVLRPEELTPPQREYLKTYFRTTIFPYLTPRAITSTPGHPLPTIPDLTLSIGVTLRDSRGSGPPRVAELALPAALPRFVALPGTRDFVPLEEVVRPHVQLLYPGRTVESAYLFRVTRDAELNVDERRAGNLADAVEEQSHRRRHRPIVRVEVERGMPSVLRDLLLRELRLEPGALSSALGPDDLYDVHGLMDLGALRQLAALPFPELRFPRFEPRAVLPADTSLWDTLRRQDILLHHPYEDFASSVVRFFEDAADDPDVVAIRATLYRAGEQSPIVSALTRAAAAGKDVSAFVELKARFDEQRNVRWARQLEAAGAHVVLGVLGAKNHAKAALVVRREGAGGTPARYAHIGTGNYNADTARFYTDLGLLTAREPVCEDVNDLFNMLTGSSVPTAHTYRECLVAPGGLLPALRERIEREAEHARAGRAARIRMKVNGISDPEIVRALYGASRAGVRVELIVRGICTLSPGIPGISDNIRVVSILGRFLEHARIYAFANGGAPEWYIGSADLRPRNLRRRVELLAPVRESEHHTRLERILDLEMTDPTAWELTPHGSYTRQRLATDAPPRRTSQETFLAPALAAEIARAESIGAATIPVGS